MDEPFGALDPITRHRLQTELRRLHRDVGKTIIFVTHDIDEAIQMGDRIAILREGGVLAQYDTPDAILAHPADDFVAKFIGEDRALRRLALRTVGEVPLRGTGHRVRGARHLGRVRHDRPQCGLAHARAADRRARREGRRRAIARRRSASAT